ncbi:hypothetical protein [Peribacillus asahii]|uniref:hypothetical protein n=1 Tax=Peribacillus asahii TaxID=228899 RepID=UPI00207926B6|nr:hypothetical protein [Peribacillus asahii]USK62479.1 hypothetical protein LIT37_24655 [Peribacillus asahii]
MDVLACHQYHLDFDFSDCDTVTFHYFRYLYREESRKIELVKIYVEEKNGRPSTKLPHKSSYRRFKVL